MRCQCVVGLFGDNQCRDCFSRLRRGHDGQYSIKQGSVKPLVSRTVRRCNPNQGWEQSGGFRIDAGEAPSRALSRVASVGGDARAGTGLAPTGNDGTGATWSGETRSIRHLPPMSAPGRRGMLLDRGVAGAEPGTAVFSGQRRATSDSVLIARWLGYRCYARQGKFAHIGDAPCGYLAFAMKRVPL